MDLMRGTIWLFLIFLLSGLPLVFAEHEPQHRFTAQGYVKDADGNPLSGVAVMVSDRTIGLTEKGVTDGNGKFSIQLHLHDDNNGDDLTISASGITFQTQVKFDPADHKTERIMRLDLMGEKWSIGGTQKTGVDIKSGALLLVLVVGAAFYLMRSPSKSSKAPTNKKLKKKRV